MQRCKENGPSAIRSQRVGATAASADFTIPHDEIGGSDAQMPKSALIVFRGPYVPLIWFNAPAERWPEDIIDRPEGSANAQAQTDHEARAKECRKLPPAHCGRDVM